MTTRKFLLTSKHLHNISKAMYVEVRLDSHFSGTEISNTIRIISNITTVVAASTGANEAGGAAGVGVGPKTETEMTPGTPHS